MHRSWYALARIPDDRDDVAFQSGGPLAPLLNAWHECAQLLQPARSMVMYAVDCMPLIIEGNQGIPCAAIQADQCIADQDHATCMPKSSLCYWATA